MFRAIEYYFYSSFVLFSSSSFFLLFSSFFREHRDHLQLNLTASEGVSTCTSAEQADSLSLISADNDRNQSYFAAWLDRIDGVG